MNKHKNKKNQDPQKILVAYDGSKASDKALKKAIELSVGLPEPLTVLAVVPDLYLTELSDSERGLIRQSLTNETNEAMERIRKSLSAKSIDVKTIVREGNPAEKVLETAKKMKIDMIVTGSHGRHGGRKFLIGSVSAKIAEYAKCSVLIVR